MADTTIDKLQIEIEASSTKAVQSIKALSDAFRGLKGNVPTTATVKRITELSNALKGIDNDSAIRLNQFSKAFERLGTVGNIKINKNLGENLRDIANSAGEVSDEAIARLNRLTSTLQKLANVDMRGVARAMRGTSNTGGMEPQAAGTSTAGGETAAGEAAKRTLADIRQSIMQANSVFLPLNQAISRAARGIGNFAKNLATAPIDRFKTRLSEAKKSIDKFFSSIGRIALYRAVRAAIKEISKAVKEGVDNLSAYSRLVGTDFHKSLDGIATDALYIKNAFATVVAPLINAVKPAIDAIADSIANALNLLAQFMATLTGASTYTKAIKKTTEYGDAVQKAGAKAKEATKSLLKIDEINRLSDNSKSGYGAGTSAEDFKSMFEEAAISDDISGFADRLKKAIGDGDWQGVGKVLGEKVNSIIDSIDWSGAGRKIGYALNGAIESSYSFLNTTNFKNLGSKIASAINSALEEINFETSGKLFVRKFTALLDIVIGALQTLNWKKIGESIAQFINGAVQEAANWLKNQDFNSIVQNMTYGLNKAIQKINWKELGKLFSDLFGTILDGAITFLSNFNWQEFGRAIGDFIVGINWGETILKLVEIGALLIKGLLEGIGGAMASIGSWLKSHVVDPIVNWVKSLFGIHSPSTVFAEIGTQLIEGLFQGISNTWHKITDFFNKTLPELKEQFRQKWSEIKTDTSEKWNTIKSDLSTKWSGIKSDATVKFETIRSTIAEKWEKTKSDTASKWSSIKTDLASKWESVKTDAAAKFENIRSQIAAKWDSTKADTSTKWNSIKSSLSEIWGNIKENAVSVFNNMSESVKSIWNGLWGAISGVINTIIGGVEKMANAVISGINAVIRSLNRLHFDMPSWLGGGSFGFSIRELSQISIPRLAGGGSIAYGQLFMARESGPELIANANGRTNVMNNDDIVDSVSDGVRDANENVVTAVYAIGNMIVRAIEGGGNGDLDTAARALYPYFKNIEQQQGASFA